MANIKLEAVSDGLIFTAFDLELGITAKCPMIVVEQGAVCVPAKLLADMVGKLPQSDVLVELKENQLNLKAGKGKFAIQCQGVDEFPELPEVEAEAVSVPATVLLNGINATAPFASDEADKQVLQAIRVTGSRDGLELAATNGHYLAVWSSDEFLFSDEIAVNLPASAATELVKLISVERDRRRKAKDETLLEVEIQLDDSQATFDVAGHKLSTRLIAGQYPNYRQLLPKQFTKTTEFDRQAFTEALERVRVVAALKNNAIKLTTGDACVILSTATSEVGDGVEDVDATVSGEPISIGFQGTYLSSILKVIQSATVRIEMNKETSPAIFSPVDGDSSAKWLCLLMPLQIRE